MPSAFVALLGVPGAVSRHVEWERPQPTQLPTCCLPLTLGVSSWVPRSAGALSELMGVCVLVGTWVPGQGSRYSCRNGKLISPSPKRSTGPFSTPSHPPAWGPRPSTYPEVLGVRWVSSQPCGMPVWALVLCGLVEERGACTVRWSSQSDDLSSRPAQLLSPALAPPKRGRGPGCTGSHKHLSSQTPSLRPRVGTLLGLSSSARHRRLCARLPQGGQVGPSQPRR